MTTPGSGGAVRGCVHRGRAVALAGAVGARQDVCVGGGWGTTLGWTFRHPGSVYGCSPGELHWVELDGVSFFEICLLKDSLIKSDLNGRVFDLGDICEKDK